MEAAIEKKIKWQLINDRKHPFRQARFKTGPLVPQWDLL